MNARRRLMRKVPYFVGIGALLLAITWLSRPSTGAPGTPGASAGGKLSQMRDRLGLSQANLGQIDPTSEALKLATLGMRGVAAQLLWSKAFQAMNKDEDYNTLSALYEQITKLQPNYISAWRFQCWNLSYNVSVEFDDYRDRYFWVIKGINFLKEGIRYNQREPRLRAEMGHFISHKIGRSDERKLFRALFKKDDDFHGPDVPEALRDNWLVGKRYFLEAEDLVDNQGAVLMGISPIIFYSEPGLAQINYAVGLEEDGTFGERAAVAWSRAASDWARYGDREFVMSEGVKIRLNDDVMAQLTREKQEELLSLAPGLAQQIRDRRLEQLLPEQQALAKKNPDDLSYSEIMARQQLDQRLVPTAWELADELPPELRAKGRELASEIRQYGDKASTIGNFRHQVNYDYWKVRCEAEKGNDCIAARRLIFEGNAALGNADLKTARASYEEGLKLWRAVLDKYPRLIADGLTGDELVRTTARYANILKQLDEPFPDPFILADVIKLHGPRKPPAKLQQSSDSAETEGAEAAETAAPQEPIE
ncbi:MAG: hypothetical protein K1X74_06760 [Pirellulales bacterium]|nr:hypothetical protein [Pirellulales bacterium]